MHKFHYGVPIQHEKWKQTFQKYWNFMLFAVYKHFPLSFHNEFYETHMHHAVLYSRPTWTLNHSRAFESDIKCTCTHTCTVTEITLSHVKFIDLQCVRLKKIIYCTVYVLYMHVSNISMYICTPIYKHNYGYTLMLIKSNLPQLICWIIY